MLGAAPVPAKERVAPDEIQRPRHRPPVAFGQNQHDVVGHRVVDAVKEGAGQIGPAPFAASGILVETPEGIPVFGAQVGAGQGADRAAEPLRLGAFAADRLALARRKRSKEPVKGAIAVVDPVELLGDAVQETFGRAKGRLVLGAEGDMGRGKAVLLGDLAQGAQQEGPVLGRRQQPRAGGGGKGHRRLQLGVIASTRARPGLGKGVVEDVFALAVPLGVKRHGADQSAVVAQRQVPRLPPRAGADRAAVLERLEKAVGGERVARAGRGGGTCGIGPGCVGPGKIGPGKIGQRVPVGGRDRGDALDDCDVHGDILGARWGYGC